MFGRAVFFNQTDYLLRCCCHDHSWQPAIGRCFSTSTAGFKAADRQTAPSAPGALLLLLGHSPLFPTFDNRLTPEAETHADWGMLLCFTFFFINVYFVSCPVWNTLKEARLTAHFLFRTLAGKNGSARWHTARSTNEKHILTRT